MTSKTRQRSFFLKMREEKICLSYKLKQHCTKIHKYHNIHITDSIIKYLKIWNNPMSVTQKINSSFIMCYETVIIYHIKIQGEKNMQFSGKKMLTKVFKEKRTNDN